MPGTGKAGGEGRDGSYQYGEDMISPAGTVGLHVTSTQREAAVGREGRCKHGAV